MQIRCWGTRGSIPTPSTQSFDTRYFGGNTTCYQIISGGLTVILDAGSGVRLLGADLMKRGKPVQAHIFFSHAHWDHIQGFPFFTPAFQPGNEFTFYSPSLEMARQHTFASIIEEVLRGQQENPTFPVTLGYMQSKMVFKDFQRRSSVVLEDDAVVLTIRADQLNHPGGCFGYRFEEERKDGSGTSVAAICTDHEHGDGLSDAVQWLAKDANVLLYDAAYTVEEYEGIGTFSRKTWGHSTWKQGVLEAQAASVPRLFLIHHDPSHDDDFVRNQIEAPAIREGKSVGIDVQAMYEGQCVDVN